MKNINKNPTLISGFCLILLTVLFSVSQAHAQGGSSLIVNTLAEGDDGACNEANCTLREAVKYAPAGATITFSVTGIIQLVDFRNLVINKNLTITGPGADSLTVKAAVAYTVGIFEISGGIVSISGLKLSDGKGKAISTQYFGGAIYMTGGALTLTSCILSNNRASASGDGGAIYAGSGVSLKIYSTTLSGNRSQDGGAIHMNGGSSLLMTDSTVSGNIADTGVGGGVFLGTNTTATVTNSTISGNSATGTTGGGGGFFNYEATLTIINSTISGNTTSATTGTGPRGGGGIMNISGQLTVANSTITKNGAVRGGGIHNNSGGSLDLSNSIVAGNDGGVYTLKDIFGPVTAGDYNLVQDTSNATLTGTHNVTGQPALLEPLQNNGGTTQTQALQAGSPALNAGDPSFDTAATPFDQRGNGYARKSGSSIDIGAFELQIAPPASADLTIVKSHTGNFTQGDTGKTYSITVTNSGGAATSGTVSMTDALPGGLIATDINGGGWDCNFSNLTCTRNDALAAGSNYPAITLTVNVADNAPSSVINQASVSGGGETNAENNQAADPTTINAAPRYAISGTVSYGQAAILVSGVSLNATGSANLSVISDTSGAYELSNLATGNYTVTPAKSEQINGITAFDATLVLRCVAAGNSCALTANQKTAADADGDTNVTAFDATQILRFVAANGQNANTGQVGNWKFIDSSKTYNLLAASQVNQDYTAFLIGEVDGDWIP